MCGFCDEDDVESMADDGQINDYNSQADVLSRVLTPLEIDYLAHCNAVISRLTGEKFVAGPVSWMICRSPDGIVQMESDGYCQKFGICIEYMGTEWDFLEEDVMSFALNANVPLCVAFDEMSDCICKVRMMSIISTGVWPIYIPHPDDLPRVLSIIYATPTGELIDMTLSEAVEEYIRRRLHQLTAHLPFIGSPRCTCVSKRDPNPNGLTIRQMIKVEYPTEVRPGQSILELLGDC